MLAIGIVISQGADLGAQLTEHREAAFVQQQDPKKRTAAGRRIRS